MESRNVKLIEEKSGMMIIRRWRREGKKVKGEMINGYKGLQIGEISTSVLLRYIQLSLIMYIIKLPKGWILNVLT
jgi:hypothetical protein